MIRDREYKVPDDRIRLAYINGRIETFTFQEDEKISTNQYIEYLGKGVVHKIGTTTYLRSGPIKHFYRRKKMSNEVSVKTTSNFPFYRKLENRNRYAR